MSLSFDGSSKVITLSAGTTALGVRDLWSRWVDWMATSDNGKYLPAMSLLGGDDIDLVAGTKVPAYVFLLNGWKIKPQEANHTLNVSDGILLVSGGGDPFVNTTGSYNVRILYQQPVQAISFATGTVDPTGLASAVWDRSRASHTTADTFGLALQDTYQAKLWMADDNSNAADRYVAVWFKNGEPVTAGITSPTIQIIKTADGTDLVASTAMTAVGSTGLFRYNEATNRLVNGASYAAKITATIGGVIRTWFQPLSRDS